MKNTDIGKRIKKIRIASGLNQSEIASYLEVDQSLISKIEKGEREASTDMLEKLAYLFGSEVSVFLDDKVHLESEITAFRANALDKDDLKMIANINRIALNLKDMLKLDEGK